MTDNKVLPEAHSSHEGEKKEKQDLVSIREFFKFADIIDLLLMMSGALCAIAVGAALPLFSIIFGGMFDRFNDPTVSPWDVGAEFALQFGYIAIAVFIAASIQVGAFTLSSERQTLRIRVRYLDALLKQDISWFDLQKSGELSAKITENTVLIRDAMGEKLGTLFQFMTMFFAGFAVGFYYSWQLTLVIFAVAPLLGIAGAIMMKFMADATGVSLGAYASSGAIAEEAITMIRTIASFGMERKTVARYKAELAKAEADGIKKSKYQGLGLGFTMLVMFLCYALALWYGTILVNSSKVDAAKAYPYVNSTFRNTSTIVTDTYCQTGVTVSPEIAMALGCLNKPNTSFKFDIDADYCSCFACECGCTTPELRFVDEFSSDGCFSGGDVILVFFSVLIGSFAIGQATPGITALTSGRAAASKIFAVINRVPDIDSESDEGVKLEHLKGEIKLENVTFAFPSRPDVDVFSGLNLEIKSGETVALVGGSGCGKSTVTQLVQRFYDPKVGTVLIDGHDLKTLSLPYFRNQVGLVGQEPVLFATTIANNIANGAPTGVIVTEEQVHAAAKAANAYDFIMEFPNGFETYVAGSGMSLSGGQKQRIAIARALIRNPSILILDEATSALDNESEHVVQQALDKLMVSKARTTIVIAHRLSTIRNANKIVVLGEGSVLEEGTHDELMQKGGHYAALESAANRSQETPELSKAMSLGEVGPQKSHGSYGSDITDLERKASDSVAVTIKQVSEAGEETEEPTEKEKSISWKRLFKYSAPEKWYYIPAMLCALGNGIIMPAFAFIFSRFLDIYYYPTSALIAENASIYALLFVGLAFYMAIVVGFQNYLFGLIGERMTTRVRAALFQALLIQEVGYYDLKENSVGAVTGKLSSDAAMVKAGLSDRLGLTVQNLFTLVAGLGIAFYFGWKLTLILLSLLPLMILAGSLEMAAAAGYAKADDTLMAEANQVLSESIGGIRTVTSFNSRKRIVKLYKKLLAGPKQLGVKKGVVGGLSFGISQGILFTMYSLAIYVGGWLIEVDGENYTFDTFFLVFFAIMMTGTGMGQAAAAGGDIGKAGNAAKNVFRVVDRQSKINPYDTSGAMQLSDKPQDITFKSVSFKYPSREALVLDDFNLRIKAGSTVALVGQSGSGKSTIVSLVDRFYDPLQGTVSLGGLNLTSINLQLLRSRIGFVSQEPKLFASTIFENIAVGIPPGEAVTKEKVEDAAKAANAHDFISSFPDKYNTHVGAKGAQLSGGQKQRIAIARAIIRNPKILLLDEATSALDNESEKVVQKALDDLMVKQGSSTTTIVIAHRLSTVENVDEIVVMDHGKVVERGRHKDLLAKKEVYFKLYNAQAGAQ